MSTTKISGNGIIEMLKASGCEFKSYDNEYPEYQQVDKQLKGLVKKAKRIQKAKEN